MKLSGDPLRFCAAPDKAFRAALIYGGNSLLIAESIRLLQESWLPAEKNDFALTVFDGDDIKSNPTLLIDEMTSFGFFASQKVILVKNAGDTTTRIAQEALALPDAGHRLILQADILGTKSTLRAWAEKETVKDVACLPCYEFEGPSLVRFVQGQFQRHGATITADAVTWLADRLGPELSSLDGTIAQLMDYVGGEKPAITLQHVEALLVDQAEHQIDALIQAIAESQAGLFDRILYSLVDSGTSLVTVIRYVQNYFYRLRTIQALIADGSTAEQAIAQLRPPLFFKLKPAILRQYRTWPLEKIDRLLAECLFVESQLKKTGTPEVALFQQRFLRVMGV